MGQITHGVGSPGTVGPASGGRVHAFNDLSTTPEQVLGTSSQRQSIIFHNPGTVDIFIAPAFVVVNNSDVALVPSISALGGCVRVFANGGSLVISGECQKPWQAFAASASNNPLTIIESWI